MIKVHLLENIYGSHYAKIHDIIWLPCPLAITLCWEDRAVPVDFEIPDELYDKEPWEFELYFSERRVLLADIPFDELLPHQADELEQKPPEPEPKKTSTKKTTTKTKKAVKKTAKKKASKTSRSKK